MRIQTSDKVLEPVTFKSHTYLTEKTLETSDGWPNDVVAIKGTLCSSFFPFLLLWMFAALLHEQVSISAEMRSILLIALSG